MRGRRPPVGAPRYVPTPGPPGSPSRASGCSPRWCGCARATRGAAIATLGLGPTQADDVRRNARLRELPTAAAERVYTGVLYDALGLTDLDASAHRRALARVAIVSSLYGLVRPGERIAPYRLGGGVSLPGLGGVAAHWRRPSTRSSGRRPAAGWSSTSAPRRTPRSGGRRPTWRARVVTVRVLHEVDGRRQVVSHFNKATKGRLVRALLEDGRDARHAARPSPAS